MRFNDNTREGLFSRFEMSTVYSYFKDLNEDGRLGTMGRGLGSQIAQALLFPDVFVRQPPPEVEENVETTEDDE